MTEAYDPGTRPLDDPSLHTSEATLDEADLAADPFTQFRAWLDAAADAGVADPHAATVATADTDGRPSARTMLLRGVDERGFVLFTNYESRKGREMTANPWAALTFYWQTLHRQVTVTGSVVRLDAAESDRYFATRPRDSQLAAWASPQSATLPDRAALEARLSEVTARYEGRDVPRPPHWGGLLVVPASVEFWQGRPYRLHDRLRFRRSGDGWVVERLAP